MKDYTKLMQKKIIILNGPNLNLLEFREKSIYGYLTYKKLEKEIYNKANELNLNIQIYQSNHEGDLIDYIHQGVINDYDIIINAAAYSHTSIAIMDALSMSKNIVVEVHLSDINTREEFRKKSFISEAANVCFQGQGIYGYLKALEFIKKERN